jgi:hypothetical protein
METKKGLTILRYAHFMKQLLALEVIMRAAILGRIGIESQACSCSAQKTEPPIKITTNHGRNLVFTR